MKSRFSLIFKESGKKVQDVLLVSESKNVQIDLGNTVCDFANLKEIKEHMFLGFGVSPGDKKKAYMLTQQFLLLLRVYKHSNGSKLPFFEAFMSASNLYLPRFSVDYILPNDVLDVMAMRAVEDYGDLVSFSEQSSFAKDTIIKSNKISLFLALKDDDKKTTTYFCDNLQDIVVALIYHILKAGYDIKECENCHKMFVPTTNKNEEYCDRISPQYPTKTCKSANILMKSLEREKSSETKILEKKIYNLLRTTARANNKKEEAFDKFKEDRDVWRENMKSGTKTESEYMTWLSSHYSEKNKRK